MIISKNHLESTIPSRFHLQPDQFDQAIRTCSRIKHGPKVGGSSEEDLVPQELFHPYKYIQPNHNRRNPERSSILGFGMESSFSIRETSRLTPSLVFIFLRDCLSEGFVRSDVAKGMIQGQSKFPVLQHDSTIFVRLLFASSARKRASRSRKIDESPMNAPSSRQSYQWNSEQSPNIPLIRPPSGGGRSELRTNNLWF